MLLFQFSLFCIWAAPNLRGKYCTLCFTALVKFGLFYKLKPFHALPTHNYDFD